MINKRLTNKYIYIYIALHTASTNRRQDLLEPLNLCVQGAVVPYLVAQTYRLEEIGIESGGTDNRHVRAFLEAGAARF